jgi:DNA-binding NtrC family response regulator
MCRLLKSTFGQPWTTPQGMPSMSHTILLIHRNQADGGAIRHALTHSTNSAFNVEWVADCLSGVQRINADSSKCAEQSLHIAAVLVDLALADSVGIDTFDRVFCASPKIPILVICGAQDESIAKLAIQRGAQDYLLTEHLDSYLLHKTLTNMIERAANAEAQFQEKEKAEVTLSSIGDAMRSADAVGRVARCRRMVAVGESVLHRRHHWRLLFEP